MNKSPILITVAVLLILFINCQKKTEPVPQQQQPPIAQPAETTTIAETTATMQDTLPPPAEVISAIGSAFVEDTVAQTTDTARPQMLLNDQNILDTKAESKMEVSLGDSEDVLVINENSRISVKNARDSLGRTQTTITIPFGRIFVDVKKLAAGYDRLSIRTPTGIAAIRGTAFEVIVDKVSKATEVKVMDGHVELRDTANQNPVVIAPAQKARVDRTRKPSIPISLKKLEVESIKQWIGGTNIERLYNRMTPETKVIIEKTTGVLLDKGAQAAVKTATRQMQSAVQSRITKTATLSSQKTLADPGTKTRDAAENVQKQAEAKADAARRALEQTAKKSGVPIDTVRTKRALDNIKKKLPF